jgi:DNA polymerase-3 subunit epsilon
MKKPLILFFDTETTGTPKDYKAPLTEWPRLVQLAAILTDIDGNVIKVVDRIVFPIGFEIPEEAANIHGITTEIATEEGAPLEIVLDELEGMIGQSDLIVGHNISFDRKIVGGEFLREGRLDPLHHTNRICTMFKSIKFCAIPGPRGFKWPKLQELHVKLFGKEFEDAHNALADIYATKDCYFKLVELGVLNKDFRLDLKQY